jgi:hypothetical protein
VDRGVRAVLGELATRGVGVHRVDSGALDPDEVEETVRHVLDEHPVPGRASEVGS